MSNILTIRDFIQSHGERLGLVWKAGQAGENRQFESENLITGVPIAGYQVLGPEEVNYL